MIWNSIAVQPTTVLGFGYLGALPKQTQKGRRPRKFFVVADVAKQLTNILEAEGVWEAVQTSKVAAPERNDTTVRDVTDGSCYRQLFEDGGFLSGPGNCNITFVVDDQTVTAKLAVLCATVDLPAKAGIMNMTLFNGADACITCKEPGLVVRQGKGHARSYPYREANQRYATRLHVDVLAAMHTATPKKRVQGFKGVSGLSELQQFDLVHGVVPEYMHGILLRVTKTVTNKWFSPTASGQPYFVGKKLKEISKRLQHIQPPDFIERLPRDLELHYNHFKATEFQMWLLFYALPCLGGILGDKYLCHFAHLSEAVHILLGDEITAESLEIAASLLDIFYKDCADCYGAGSCGINVHNAGVHLVSCVRQWGPLWAWSCFCFEDANAMILQAVHGTGDVTKQVIRFKETQGVLHREGGTITDRTNWSKVNMVQANCGTAGALKPMSASSELLVKTGASTSAVLRKALRVKLEHQKLYSEEYPRMRRHVCHVAVLDDGRISEAVTLFEYGQIHKDLAKAKSDRLRVEKNCSLVIKNVTEEDAGRYICRQFKSGEQVSGSEVYLSVVTMTKHQDNDEVTLDCSLKTYGECRHSVKWLLQGRDVVKDHRDIKTSQSFCSATVTFLTSHFSNTPRTEPQLFLFSPQHFVVSFIKGDDAGKVSTVSATPIKPTSTKVKTTSEKTGQVGKNPGWRWIIVVIVAVAALTIITVAVIRRKRTQGTETETDDNVVVALDEDEVRYDAAPANADIFRME
ncbi:hypothetical protein JOQ06_005043, partial [Pogonophryne albipinna]